MKPAIVRWYIDADLLGLAKVLVALRPDVTYPGDQGGVVHKRERPPCPVTTTATPDREWIPEVARRGWSVITRDRGIERRPDEIAAVRANGAGLFAITSREQLTRWHQLEIVMSRWRDLERIAKQPGPFIYAVTRTQVRRVAPSQEADRGRGEDYT